MTFKDIFWKPEQKRSVTVTLPKDEQDWTMYGQNIPLFNALGLTRQTRTLPVIYACVELISSAISCIPLRVMQVDGCGHKELVKHHPVQRVFADKTIQTMSMAHCIKNAVEDMLLKGNGFIYIKRGESGVVTGLRWLSASDVNVLYNEKTDIVTYTCSKIGTKKIKASDMIHITKNTRDGVNGVALMNYARETISLATSAENAAKVYFDSGCNLSGILTPQTPINEKQRQQILQSWKTDAKGNSIQLLPFGVNYTAIGSNASDAQLLETRQYNVIEVCRYFNINPVLLQDMSHTSYNTLEQVSLQFLQYTLYPYIKDIESEFTRKLFVDEDFVVDMDEDAYLLRTDKTTTANYFNSFVQSGVMSVNEVRQQLGMSDIEDGDAHLAMYQDSSKANLANSGGENQENLPE